MRNILVIVFSSLFLFSSFSHGQQAELPDGRGSKMQIEQGYQFVEISRNVIEEMFTSTKASICPGGKPDERFGIVKVVAIHGFSDFSKILSPKEFQKSSDNRMLDGIKEMHQLVIDSDEESSQRHRVQLLRRETLSDQWTVLGGVRARILSEVVVFPRNGKYYNTIAAVVVGESCYKIVIHLQTVEAVEFLKEIVTKFAEEK